MKTIEVKTKTMDYSFILEDQTDITRLFVEWMKENYKKYIGFNVNTCVWDDSGISYIITGIEIKFPRHIIVTVV